MILHLVYGHPAVARSANEHSEALIVRPCFGKAVVPEGELVRIDIHVLEGDRIAGDLKISQSSSHRRHLR